MLTHTHRRATLALALLAACLLPVITQAQSTVRIVVDRDFVNIRIVPALGADLVGTANAGTPFTATGRSPDNEWLQIDFAGGEAWVSSVVVTVLEGDIGALPIRDPRTIPYGGTDAPRAGFTDATSDIIGRLPLNGVRVRSGPSVAYVVLADAPRFTEFPLLGRTPNNQWIQVNFDGTLGWVASQFVEIQDNRNIEELPIDGVVANQQPLDFDSENEFFGVLRRMRDRLDIAQASLEQIQAIWTDAALGIVPFCGNYPSQPTSFNLPRAIYAEYFALIDPILNDLNAAFAAHEQSIELLIEACNRPGSQAALISIPVTTGGLELANSADNAYVGLRRRIDELLPELGPDDCVFSFGGRVDVLPYLGPLVSDAVYVFTDNFDLTRRTNGYCFDATTSNI
ncbi:MAG: SH3 domain-containing protein, partial [Chloroflexota bacterium]